MARKARNTDLEFRTNRLSGKLKIRREPYWHRLTKGGHLGYRRIAQGNGTWIGRWRPEGGERSYEALGSADDYSDADGLSVLSFGQVQDKAHAFFARKVREAAGEFVSTGPYTVADTMQAYFADREGRGDKAVKDDRSTANAHILPELGAIAVDKLTKSKIVNWHHAIAALPARVRSKANNQRFKEIKTDEDKRRRRVSANRALAMLKRALNHAHEQHKVANADAWVKVKLFRGVNAARIRFLDDGESKRLINACGHDTDIGHLVTAGLLTGCRYGELGRLLVEDFHAKAGTIQVRVSKSNKPRHVALTAEGQQFFARLCLNKGADDQLLTFKGRRWSKSDQERPMREACNAARLTGVSFHTLRHTYASRLVMKGVPLAVVAAQLGHASIEMVEKHYGHLAPNYVAETVRSAFGVLGVVDDAANVTTLQTA
jgi:integrase